MNENQGNRLRAINVMQNWLLTFRTCEGSDGKPCLIVEIEPTDAPLTLSTRALITAALRGKSRADKRFIERLVLPAELHCQDALKNAIRNSWREFTGIMLDIVLGDFMGQLELLASRQCQCRPCVIEREHPSGKASMPCEKEEQP